MRYLQLLFIPVFVIALFSCRSPECKNTNPIFDQFSPESQEYKHELKKQLEADPGEHTEFWTQVYLENDGKEYLNARVIKKHLCAIMILEITNNKDLEQFRKNKGAGYIGSELYGVSYAIVDENGSLNFKLENASGFID
jgi:hypothetical protein